MSDHETKTNIIFRLGDYQSNLKNNHHVQDVLNYEIIAKTNPNTLLISNPENAYKQSIKCQYIFPPQTNNSTIFEKLQDSKCPIVSMMLKGYNVMLCNMGKSGSGKTNSFFGVDSPYNDSDLSFNIITKIYEKLKGQFKPGEENLFVFSLSVVEVTYDEQEQLEITRDLLDVLNEENQNKGFVSVIFKNVEELEQILHFSWIRSANWRTNFDEEKNSHEFKFLSNQSHLILTLNIINIRTKKNNSLSIFDLIGFKPNQKDELKQLSLSYLMQFFNEIIANRDQISKFKNEFLKKNKVLSNNILSFPSLNNKNLNFINLFAKHWFNSYCMIFAHGSLKTDLYRECHFFLDKLAELSGIPHTIEKKQIMNYSQFLNFPSFIKSTESYINDYQENSQEENKNIENKEEKYFSPTEETNQQKETENETNINEKLSSELKNIYQKIDLLNSRINFSEIAEESEENEKSLPNSAKNKSNLSSPENQKINKISKIEQEEKPHSEKKQLNIQSNKENIYEIYDRKAKNIMATLMNYEFPSAPNKGDLYIIKRNYELLLNLFSEGEDIRKNLMLQFVELKDSLLEINAEFEIKLNDEKLKNVELQKKNRLLVNESEAKLLIESYEEEIRKLNEDKFVLIKENERLMKEIAVDENEDKNLSFSSKKNILIKNNRNLLIRLQEKDKEISEFKKKERNFIAGQKILNQLSNKNSTILKNLSQKENQEKRVVDICSQLEKENKDLKQKIQEIQKNFKSLSEEYFKNKEQLFLFKEMASAPDNYFPSKVKKAKLNESSPIKQENEKLKAFKCAKEKTENIFSSLKSLID